MLFRMIKASDSCKPRGYEWFVASYKHINIGKVLLLAQDVEGMMKGGRSRWKMFSRS